MRSAGYILEGDGIFSPYSRPTKKVSKKNKNRLKMIKQSRKQNRKDR